MTDEGDVRHEIQNIVRNDFWVSTSNKQLNFAQYVRSIWQQYGRAAVVVPDNVLFEGGAGEVVRRRQDLDGFVACYNPEDRHDRQPAWSEAKPEGCWRSFTYEELMARDKTNLDIFWLRDESLEESANLPYPDLLVREIMEELKAALEQFAGIMEELGGEEK